MIDSEKSDWVDRERKKMKGLQARGTDRRERRAALHPDPTPVSVVGDVHPISGTAFVVLAARKRDRDGAVWQTLHCSAFARPFDGDRVLALRASTPESRRVRTGRGEPRRERGRGRYAQVPLAA